MKRFFSILICCLFGMFFLQETHAQSDKITLAYFGGYITHPGLKIGYSRPFKTNSKINKKQRNVKTEWSYGASFGTYFHSRNHTSIQVLPELDYTHTQGSGFQWGASLGAGFQRTFIPNSYQLNGENEIEKKSFAGQNLFAINPAIKIGKEVKGKPIAWFIKPQTLLSMPYFEGLNTYFLLEAGITYSIQKK